jgi:hypothetical protein
MLAVDRAPRPARLISRANRSMNGIRRGRISARAFSREKPQLSQDHRRGLAGRQPPPTIVDLSELAAAQ